MNKFIVSQRKDGKWQIIKERNKRATKICNNGIELQQEIGWMVINRICLIEIYKGNGYFTVIDSSYRIEMQGIKNA